MQSFINDQKTHFFLILLVSIGIGLQSVIYKVAIIALLLQWILGVNYRKKLIKLRKDSFAIGLIGLYFLYAISFFWSENNTVAVTDIILKSPLLVLPLVILSKQNLSVKQLNIVFLSFALSSIGLNLYTLFDAYLLYRETNNINNFYYSNLTINMHTAYQSMFTCFSIVLFVYLFVRDRFISKWMVYIVVLIQIVFVLLLSSRMQILIMIFMAPAFLIVHYANRKQLLRGLLYTILIFSFSILSFSFLIISAPKQVINDRYKTTVSHINSIGIDSGNSDVRKFIWAAGIEIIENNWLFGVGAGDIKDTLLSKYSKQILKNPTADNLVDSTILQIQTNNKTVSYLKEKAINSNRTYKKELRGHAEYILIRKNNRYKNSLKAEYNFHNQYLQTFSKIGIFGLLILCYLLAYLFVLSIRRKDYLTILFVFIVGASFLTESMLERQAGVVFFPFFYSLLISRANQSKLS